MKPTYEDWAPTRQSLLVRLKHWDDADSWREFFNLYGRMIYAVARKSGLSDAEAQDVVQETIIEVSRKMPGFKYDPQLGSFKGWLATLTRWRIGDRLRKRRREPELLAAGREPETTGGTPPIEKVPDPASEDPAAVWNAEWEKSLLQAAIEKVKAAVSPRQYQIFDLCVFKQWPAEKIKQTLGVNRGQVYLAKHRVGALLKKELRSLKSKFV